jgi:hypothetical protein
MYADDNKPARNNVGKRSNTMDGSIQDEITENLTVALKQSASERVWKMIAIILGLILTGGTILSVAGKAFYVTRTEYTDRVLQDSIKEDRLSNSLDALRVTIFNLEGAVKQDVEAITTIRVEMAKNKHANER